MKIGKYYIYVILTVITFLIAPSFLTAYTNSFTIDGTAVFNKAGDVYVKLLDKEQFEKDVKGLDPQTPFVYIIKAENGVKKAPFKFAGVPGGTYAIACFQDVDGNGKLDIGMFGPTEPWGYYGKRPSFIPVFKEESFILSNDLTNITIEIK